MTSERKCIVVLLATAETSSLLVWDDFCERIMFRRNFLYFFMYGSFN